MSEIIGVQAGIAAFLLRLALGIVFIVHGYPKLFREDFGPVGFSEYLKTLGVPAPLAVAYLVGILEFVGGWLLIAGFLARLVALLIVLQMIFIIVKIKFRTGFATHATEGGVGGYEFDFVLLIMSLVVALFGAGRYSIDFLYLQVW
jgi:putative oxidoreductase